MNQSKVREVPIPTDEELNETIKNLKFYLEFMEEMLKLNDRGRKEIIIYMFGLLTFDEFRKEADYALRYRKEDMSGERNFCKAGGKTV